MISTEPHVLYYVCDGGIADFGFDFRIQSQAQLRVARKTVAGILTDLVLNSDYTVSINGHDDGGTVHIIDESHNPLKYPDGEIIIGLGLPITQTLDYVENDRFPAESHEGALDKLTLVAAQSRQDVERCFRVPFGRRALELPHPSLTAGKLWACDTDGNLLFVPTVRGDDMLSIDAAAVYFDHNLCGEPMLMLDVTGKGKTIIEDTGNGGGMKHATIAFQDDIPAVDSSVQRVWFSAVFRGQQPSGPEITNNRSHFLMGLDAYSQMDAVPTHLTGEGDPEFFPQAVGGLAIAATAGPGSTRTKMEALVVSAKEDPEVAGPSKGVAIQAITVRATQGPSPDDRTQLSASETDGNGTEEDDIRGLGSITLRLNGGTVQNALHQPVFGGWRSWAAVYAGGRSGYLNGLVMGKTHHLRTGDTDPEGVGGWGGVWGGRSFWHEDTFAVYAKDDMEGWVCIGHDGVPATEDSNGINSLARAPIDIEAPDADTIIALGGEALLAKPKAGWAPATGAASRASFDTSSVTLVELAKRVKALIDDLHVTGDAHGLLDT